MTDANWVEGIIGIAFVVLAALGVIFYIFVRYIVNNYETFHNQQRTDYERLNREQRDDTLYRLKESKQREEQAELRSQESNKMLNTALRSVNDVTKTLERLNASITKQSQETNIAIGAIDQTTKQLGNTVTTLTSTVDGLSKTMGYVVQKVNDQEVRSVKNANKD